MAAYAQPLALPLEPLDPLLAAGLLPALSIRQPWAHAILHAGKDVENRNWPTRFRGRVLIHAAKGMDEDDVDGFRDLLATRSIATPALKGLKVGDLQRGGIIGEVEIVDCVRASGSPWFVGDWGFVVRNPRPIAFAPCRGMLGFFKPSFAPRPALAG